MGTYLEVLSLYNLRKRRMEWGGEECVGREEERGETEMPGLSYSAETEYGDSAEEAFSVHQVPQSQLWVCQLPKRQLQARPRLVAGQLQ